MNKTTKKPGKRLSAENIATGKRLHKYIMDLYKYRFIMVFICILLSAVASISVSLSLKYLLDDFIIPLIGQKSPNYTELYQALMVLGAIFLIGVIATFTYTRMMVYIGQRRVACATICCTCRQIRYFDQNERIHHEAFAGDTRYGKTNRLLSTGTDVIFTIVVTFIVHARAKPASYRSCGTHHPGSPVLQQGCRLKQWKIFHPSTDNAGKECDWIIEKHERTACPSKSSIAKFQKKGFDN